MAGGRVRVHLPCPPVSVKDEWDQQSTEREDADHDWRLIRLHVPATDS